MSVTPEAVRRTAGWLLMLHAAVIPGLADGHFLSHENSVAALIFALLLVVFLLVIAPRLGSIHEWPGVISALVVGTSVCLILNHVLDHRAEGVVANVYHGVQSFTRTLLRHVLDEGSASTITSPLYMLCAAVLLVSFAMRTMKGFAIIYGLLILYGLYPFSVWHLAAYLCWFAGFLLVIEPQLHLPLALRTRLRLSRSDRDFLLAVREQPLTESQAVWELCGEADPRRVPGWCAERLRVFSAAALIEFDPMSRLVVASPVLRESDLLPGTAAVVSFISIGAQIALAGLAAIYLVLPFDLLPEAIMGPAGYVDDLLVLALAALPFGKPLRRLLARPQPTRRIPPTSPSARRARELNP